jgi:hypothetical protein
VGDPISKETMFSMFFFYGVLEGIIMEYQKGQCKLVGMDENEREVKEYGKLNEVRLMEELFQLRYPEIDFEGPKKEKETDGKNGINWEEVLLKSEAIALIENGLKARYPMVDLTEINYEKMRKQNGRANDRLKQLLKEKGYENTLIK